ncbi:uncharacterized protein [Haliotis asinina]|uniref:uncharacterized protein n=1 Tax=Haliotis asinina TaxID=109174 RepID=UPI003531D509
MVSSDILRHVILIGVRMMCNSHIETGCLIFIAAVALTCFMVVTIALLLFIKGPKLLNLAVFCERTKVSCETEEPRGAVQETAYPLGTVREAEDSHETVREAEDSQETVHEAEDSQETVQEAEEETEKLDEVNTRESMKTRSRSPYVKMARVQDPGAACVPPGYAVPCNAKPLNPSPQPSPYLCMRTSDSESKDRNVYPPPCQTSPTKFGDRETAAINSGHYLCMDPLQETVSLGKI